MSDKKKLDEILDLLKSLEERVKKLEGESQWRWRPNEDNPYKPIIKKRKCPHCNGTGVVDEHRPFRDYPYYMG